MSSGDPGAVVLATRISAPPGRSDIEILCLRKTSPGRYRLFTTTSLSLDEDTWDLDPVEFYDANDADALTYLIESLWRLEVSPPEINSLIRHLSRAPSKLVSSRDIQEKTLIGLLLAEVESRLLMLDASGSEAATRYQSIHALLERIHRMPFISATTSARLTQIDAMKIHFPARQDSRKT
jgi:hypothetical protein